MNQKLLGLLSLGFGALLILQALLGEWLFIHNVGITPLQIASYYAEKSFHGLLEVLVPHVLFIGIALMALLHFLAFIGTIEESTKKRFVHLLFSCFVLDQSSGALISLGWEWCAYVKLLASGMFQILLIWIWISLYRCTLQPLEKQPS